METFEEQIEGLTKIVISASGTAPTQTQVSQFLKDGVKDVIRKLMASGAPPSTLTAFAKLETIENGSGLASPSGVYLGVTKGDGSVLNPAREIPSMLKGRVADSSSLFYASKYNPVYYTEAGKIYIKPDPGVSGSTLQGEVLHIAFDNEVNHNSVSISDFPESTEYLVVYYAAGMACLTAATNLHVSLPTSPTAPDSVSFIYDEVSLPTPPEFDAPNLALDFTDVNEALANDDPDMADKFLSIIEKQLDAYDKQVNNADKQFNEEQVEFTEETKRRMTHADKQLSKQLGESTTNIKNYTAEIQQFAVDVNKVVTRYKWFMQQYSFLMGQYTSGIAGMGIKPKAESAGNVKAPTQQGEE